MALEALLLGGFLWHDEFFIAEACLIFGEREIIVILRIVMCGLFIRANLPIFPIVLFGGWLDGVFFVFDIVRGVVVSCAGIAVFSTT